MPRIFEVEIIFRWMSVDATSVMKVNIGSGYDLVPLGSRSLPEPMFTKITDVKW